MLSSARTRACFLCAPSAARSPCRAGRVAVHATTKTEQTKADQMEGRGNNVGEYCSIDETGKKMDNMTLMEKETQFLEAMEAYYMEGKSTMTDEEFENLRDELYWSGSQVAILSANEQRFLEATMAFNNGNQVMSNEEYDKLKGKLKEEGSAVVSAGPRCSIRSHRLYSDATPDYLKLTLLNVPAAVVVLGFVFGVDAITGFGITRAIELPPPWSILFLWGIVFPAIYTISASITNFVLPDALILKADCPNCGAKNQAYFGGIFNIDAVRSKEAITECPGCKADLKFLAVKRDVIIETTPLEKAEQKKAQKEAAEARKKAGKK